MIVTLTVNVINDVACFHLVPILHTAQMNPNGLSEASLAF